MKKEVAHRVLFRKHHRCSVAVQKRHASPGAIPYEIGKEDVTVEKFIKSLRPGSVAEMRYLALLAEPKSRKNPEPAKTFHALYKMLKAQGAVVFESFTGLWSDKSEADMLIAAVTDIRNGLRGRTAKGQGRPKTAFSEADLDICDREWHSRKNDTREAAIAAIIAKGVRTGTGELPNLTSVRRALKRAGKID